MTPAGPDTYGRFMRVRIFDCWMHEQDIRRAVGRPGHVEGPAVDRVPLFAVRVRDGWIEIGPEAEFIGSDEGGT